MEDTSEKKTQKENQNSFSQMLEEYDVQSLDTSEPLQGHIIDFIDDRVIVDIGSKTEGMLPREELLDWEGNLNYKVGDTISVVYKRRNLAEGYIIVSKREYDRISGWEKIKSAFKDGEVVSGRIMDTVPNNKGFMVDFGVQMFLPMSHVDIRKVTNFKKYSGREFQFKILKLDERNKTGVVSRRRVLEEENKEKVAQLMEEIEVGQELKGVVVSILDYGLFVDIGGINGFLHKNELSYGKVGHPKEKFRKGDEITVMVIDFNKEENKITLGYKQRFPNPWENIEKKYPVGERFKARVTKILSFGAFIELEEGVEGLLHISDLTWEGTPDTVEDYVAVGDELWVQVIDLNPEEKKIKLGLKQLELRPEEKYIEQHGKGEVVTAKVKKILKTVVFVGLEDNVEGIIKISDIKYFRIDSPADFLSEGQEIQAMILSDELDKNYKVKLGLKQIEDDAWREFFNSHKVGSVIKVKVKKIMNNGVKVHISDAIEGFVRIGEISKKRIEPEEIAQEVTEGEEREALLVNAQPDRKRINLSFKAVSAKKEKEDIEKYMKSDDSKSVTTIGDLLETEMDKKKK